VSVINQMLQELDRRGAAPGSEAEQPPQQVKAIAPARGAHEWFWRIVAILMLGAVSWVGWVAYQLQPRAQLATEQAFKAAEQARRSGGPIASAPAVKPAAVPPLAAAPSPAPVIEVKPPAIEQQKPAAELPKPAVEMQKPAPPPQKPAAEVQKPVPQPQKPAARETPETLKLAQAIQTPIPERPFKEPARAEPKPPAPEPQVAAPKPPPPAPVAAKPKPAPVAKKPAAEASAKSQVDKRERSRSAPETAEMQFRRAAVFLNQGRVSEAEDQLVGALLTDPSHAPARQAYVALLLEQQRVDAAKRVLKETLATNPAQPTFALVLARILAEQRDYPGALEAMDRAGSAANNADFQALRGTVLQRLGRHQEAVEAYQAAVQGAPQPGTTWVGMAISLEALGRRADAAQAYRRSLGSGLSREVREYAESRARALE
jgi:MSHA biogenesis protein MshN